MGTLHSQRLTQPTSSTSLTDAAERWRLARLRSFQLIKDRLALHADESTALAAARTWTPDEHKRLLRAVFDTSRAFGKSLARYTSGQWTLTDIQEFVSGAGVPCFSGAWSTSDTKAARLTRSTCATEPGVLACAYWREALDGLTMGLGDTTRHARHRSRGHGDGECVDVLYADRASEFHYGPLPGEMTATLLPLIERMAGNGVKLNLLGYSEGTLYYTLSTASGPACGAGKDMLLAAFRKAALQSYPSLVLADAAPRAVYGEP